MHPRGTRRLHLAVAIAAALLPLAAHAGPALSLLPITCDPVRAASGGDGYMDSTGHYFIGDAFPDCLGPELWNGVGSYDDEEPFTYAEYGDVRWDGSALTARVEMELGVPDDGWAMLYSDVHAWGSFQAPPPGPTLPSFAPARFVFEVERGSSSPGLELGVSGRVQGPGVDVRPRLRELPDGVHVFDALLEAGATYEVFVQATGELEASGSLASRVSLSVLAPEPGRPLLLVAAALALAGRGLHRAPPRTRRG